MECPFSSLLQTASNRFEAMGLPAFPAAHLLVFYGGIENGFWGFSHNPSTYSQHIDLPSLLMYGQKDGRVKQSEIDIIYEKLQGEKELLIFPAAGHGNYLEVDEEKWLEGVKRFLR